MGWDGEMQKPRVLGGMFLYLGGSFKDGLHLEGGIGKYLASPVRAG